LTELSSALVAGLRAMSAWELAAVVLALAYLLLAIRQNRWCWVAAIASASIYSFLMADARLYLQSALQLFYIGMAVYGWWCWRSGRDGESPPVVSWTASDHRRPLLIIFAAGLVLGLLLDRYTDAALPWLDALTASGAIVTTWMVARKVLQNWHYWFVIDLASAWLYASQGLWLTALLFLFYLVLVVFGYLSWRRSLRAHD